MKHAKSFITQWWLCCALVMGGLGVVQAPAQEEGEEQEIPRIAVADLTPTGVPNAVATVTSNFLRDGLINTGRFVVLERSAMDDILKEQAFQKSGCTTTECAVEIGKMLNVKYMLVGEVQGLKDEAGKTTYFISVRVVDVETAVSTISRNEECASQSQLKSGARKVVEFIAPQIGSKVVYTAGGGDDGGMIQNVLTVLGIVGLFVAGIFGG